MEAKLQRRRPTRVGMQTRLTTEQRKQSARLVKKYVILKEKVLKNNSTPLDPVVLIVHIT